MSAAAPAAPVRAALLGASGRMGRAILAASVNHPRLTVSAALASRASAALGQDSGALAGGPPNGVPVTHDLEAALGGCDVVLDFSSAQAAAAHLAACRAARRPLLLGSTGFGASLEAQLAAAARDIALLVAPNTSLGVSLLIELARRAADALGGFDIHIHETHHRLKRDAPSGTAIALRTALSASRPGAEIPVSSVREGEVVGEHTVVFGGAGEELTLGHRALERGVFARGAVAAALWLASRPPGRYAMADMLVSKTGT